MPPPQPQLPQLPQLNGGGNKKLKSVANLLAGDVPSCIPGARLFNEVLAGDVPPYIPGARIFNEGTPVLNNNAAQYVNQGAALYDLISSKFNAVITLIDSEKFSGDEKELDVYRPPQPLWQQEQQPEYSNKELSKGKSKGMTNNAISSAMTSTNYFAKVNLYANSRLPPNLPPMKL